MTPQNTLLKAENGGILLNRLQKHLLVRYVVAARGPRPTLPVSDRRPCAARGVMKHAGEGDWQ